MKSTIKLTAIGLFGGLILMIFLKLIILFTGNTAYILLFNFDYIPVINNLRPVWFYGYVFHYVTCVVSVISLFFILKHWQVQRKIYPYILVYTLGGGALFFLTALSPQPPAANDFIAWLYWTIGHSIFGLVVGLSVKKWMK